MRCFSFLWRRGSFNLQEAILSTLPNVSSVPHSCSCRFSSFRIPSSSHCPISTGHRSPRRADLGGQTLTPPDHSRTGPVLVVCFTTCDCNSHCVFRCFWIATIFMPFESCEVWVSVLPTVDYTGAIHCGVSIVLWNFGDLPGACHPSEGAGEGNESVCVCGSHSVVGVAANT